jgi:ABC-type sulfate transport system permease subunit
MKFWNKLNNKEQIALIFGVAIGWAITRTFEDGNLLVTTVVTIFCANASLYSYKVINMIYRKMTQH